MDGFNARTFSTDIDVCPHPTIAIKDLQSHTNSLIVVESEMEFFFVSTKRSKFSSVMNSKGCGWYNLIESTNWLRSSR